MVLFIIARGSRISHAIMTAGVGVGVKIAVWGAAGLNVGPNDKSLASIKWLGPDNQNNTWFELTGLRIGYVMVEAKKDAAVWDYFQLAIQAGAGASAGASGGAAAPPGPNASGLYTTNPHEVKTTRTK